MSMDSCISALATAVGTELKGKQDVLVSGTDIKTVNGTSLLGSGNLVIAGGGTTYTAGNAIDLTGDVIAVTAACDTKWSTDTIVDISGKQDTLVSGTTIKTINGNSVLGSGDLFISGGGSSDSAICVISENGKTGYATCYRAANPTFYGDIGNNAIDFSYFNYENDGGATGDMSFAVGLNATAAGETSTAIGAGANAYGMSSVAFTHSKAYCSSSIAFNGGNACAAASVAIGGDTYGLYSIAIGKYSCTYCTDSVAIGRCSISCGNCSLSIGNYTNVNVDNAIVLGQCVQIGSDSTKIFAVGNGTATHDTTTDDYNVHLSVDLNGLTCTKQLKIVDGTQGAGKVLTSDDNGLASWVTPSGGAADWSKYLTEAEFVSTSSQSGYDILTYNYNGTTVYRKVPSPYSYTEDAFYSDGGLTNLLAARRT